jgi:hypothetical protein
MNRKISKAISDFLKAKAEYEHLKVTSCGQKLDDACEEYERTETTLRAYSEEK